MEIEHTEEAQDFLAKFEEIQKVVDECEAKLAEGVPVDCPVKHTFTPHLYCREIFIPAGTILTSKIHMTEHPYIISYGMISVWTAEEGVKTFQAPYQGITKPGTRRILFAHSDVIWTTMHVTDETDVDKIEEQIILKRVNPLLLNNSELKEAA